MRICFISSEVFASRRGGFGKLIRIVGRELAKRGFEVYAITWRDPGMREYMEVEGIKVLSYPYMYTSRSALRHVADYARVAPLIRRVDADVYISIDCMVETYIAMRVMPHKKHIIWVQDPFDENDYRLLSSVDPNYRFNRFKFEATRALYAMAYGHADLILTQARYYMPKIARLYRVDAGRVRYLPNPVERVANEASITKAKEPTVSYLGRMDPQKRYWLFFELARLFPEVKFIAMGAPNELYKDLYEKIVEKYQGLENLEIKGFVSEEEKSRILSKCWVLCLPSIREGLPIGFLEALAHKCALLSTVNPDDLVEKFGYYAKNLLDLKEGISTLISKCTWRELGETGYNYIRKNHELNLVTNRLINHLEKLE